jgi:hypothetical protein
MPKLPDPETVRADATAEVRRLLGIEPTVDALLSVAYGELGENRAGRLLELARLAPITRRDWATAAIAQLVLGTRDLGLDWWTSPHEDLIKAGQWESRGTPDGLLEAGHASWATIEWGGSCLERLGWWIADDVSDRRWGRPIDYVDLNDYRPDDQIVLPEGAQVGDRYVASWDPGGRIWVDVVERDGPPDLDAERQGRRRGRLGSKLGDYWYDEIEDLWEAWMDAVEMPVRLPGETLGDLSDPLVRRIDQALAERLAAWALANGATNDEVAAPWTTGQDLWAARVRLTPFRRPGRWIHFDGAIRAAIDGDETRLAKELALLPLP